jgi:hypothetical protein
VDLIDAYCESCQLEQLCAFMVGTPDTMYKFYASVCSGDLVMGWQQGSP